MVVPVNIPVLAERFTLAFELASVERQSLDRAAALGGMVGRYSVTGWLDFIESQEPQLPVRRG